MNWRSLPKVELHLHMDISLSVEAAHQLNTSLTQEIFVRDYIAPAKCTDLVDFLERVPRVLDMLQTEHALQLLVQDVFRQLVEDHIIYCELRFAPMLHTQQGLSPKEVVNIVEAAVDQSSKDSGVEARLILCSLRHFSAEQSMQTVQLAHQFQGSRVIAFDLAGDEAGYPLATHLEAFRFARDRNIAITSHAGEAVGAESVWETLSIVGPSRIGHGVRSIEDPALVNYLKQKQVHLEICPTNNVQLNVFETYIDHSINNLYHQDVPLSISTDNRTLTPITLSKEYEKIASVFGWDKNDFLRCNIYAIRAAFLPEAIKEDLIRHITSAYQVEKSV